MPQAATTRVAYREAAPTRSPSPTPHPEQVKVAETFIKNLAAKLGKLPPESQQREFFTLPPWAMKFAGPGAIAGAAAPAGPPPIGGGGMAPPPPARLQSLARWKTDLARDRIWTPISDAHGSAASMNATPPVHVPCTQRRSRAAPTSIGT